MRGVSGLTLRTSLVHLHPCNTHVMTADSALTHVGHWVYRDKVSGTLSSRRPQSRGGAGPLGRWSFGHDVLEEVTPELRLEG